MNRSEREIERVLLDVILLDGEQDEAPDLSDMAVRAKAILAKREQERRFARANRQPHPPRAPGKTKRTRTEERALRMEEIRAAVMRRAGFRCEACQAQPAFEAHHVLSGPSRRHAESTSTVMALCWGCHRAIHAGEPGALMQVAAWAELSGSAEAKRAVKHRIGKVIESRAARAGGTHG